VGIDKQRDAQLSTILGNVGIILAFRCGVEDATLIEEVFFPVFSAHDLRELPNWEAYLKLDQGETEEDDTNS